MKKIIILLLFIFIVSGCSADYNIYFGESKIKEEVSIITDGIINDYKGLDLDTVYIEDEIINNDNYVFNDSNLLYKKVINVKNNKSYSVLTTEYEYNNLESHYNANKCFDQVFFDKTDEYYYLLLKGFNCELTGELNVTISSYYEVMSSNGKKEKDGSYTWKLSDSNINDIEIMLNKQKSSTESSSATQGINIYKIVMYILLVVIGIVLLIIKKKDSKK